MKLFSLLLICLLLVSCASGGQSASEGNSQLSRIAKSDIDEVIEVHQQAVMADLKLMMIKLYKRNPDMRHDRNIRSISESVELTFSRPLNTIYDEWVRIETPDDIVRMALDQRFQGDRVRAYILGIRKMLMASYDNRSEFFYLTNVDQQKLYNSARNLEIAAWLLAERKDADGQPVILSDSVSGEQRNLSYQRLFGQMIATQDNLAKIISQKTGRILKTVIVQAASMAFLPI